jgi:wyosine [tRNA(Phe)-imidazoG37] synthetase (radical SAM superfamily)
MSLIFGPIKSRRFGLSLGVDLSPDLKQCNFDCLYCELKKSDKLYSSQELSTPMSDIIDEIREELQKHRNIDVLTVTANGEPTLYPKLNELIKNINYLKEEFSFKTLILSNSGNIYNGYIQETLKLFDKVKLSIDCATEECFKKVDRPVKGIKNSDIQKGIQEFSKSFSGELYIETLFLKDINSKSSEVEKLNSFYSSLEKVERIDIGSIDRPPAYKVEGISYEELLKISKSLDSKLPIFISKKSSLNVEKASYSREELIQTVSRRPLTEDDTEYLFDDETLKLFSELKEQGAIQSRVFGGVKFFGNW